MFIYKITHIDSGLVYIGQTTRTIANRWREHCKGYKQSNNHLHRAIQKHGQDAFRVEQIAMAETLEELNALEEHFITELDCLRPKGYNLLKGGNNRRCHEETKSGMSDAWILKHVGMDKDELLRLKQITGLADLFRDKEFSAAFETKS